MVSRIISMLKGLGSDLRTMVRLIGVPFFPRIILTASSMVILKVD